MPLLKNSLLVSVSICFLAQSALARPNNGGGGKYARCQAAYDSCVSDIVFTPGTQPYNVAKARCYRSWKSCTSPTKAGMLQTFEEESVLDGLHGDEALLEGQ